MKFYICIFLFLIIQTKFIFKERLIGDFKSHNIKLTIKINPAKRTKEINFNHVVNETICFRFKQKNLSSKVFNRKELKGYAITGINILNYKNQLMYELELYRSNGSFEIYLVYNEMGQLIIKTTVENGKTKNIFYKKSIDTSFFDLAKTLEKNDLTYLY